jgi:hypothetical protein
MTKAGKIKGGLSGLVKQRGGAAQPPRMKVKAALPEAVNDHARQHGIYERDGNRGTINRGGTPIARWTRDGLLSESQIAAIEYCIKLWDRAGKQNGLVQDLLKVVGQQPSSGWAQQDALDELKRFREQVPRRYWDVFENVCRFDEPAGVAGSKLTLNADAQTHAARLCVCFVADLIAMWKRLS